MKNLIYYSSLAVIPLIIVAVIVFIASAGKHKNPIQLSKELERFYWVEDFNERLNLDLKFEGDLDGETRLTRQSEYLGDKLQESSLNIDSHNQHVNFNVDLAYFYEEGVDELVVNRFSGNDSFINYLGEEYKTRKQLDYTVFAESNFDNAFGYPSLKAVIVELSKLEFTKTEDKVEIIFTEDHERILELFDRLLGVHSFGLNSVEDFRVFIETKDDKLIKVKVSFDKLSIQAIESDKIFTGTVEYLVTYP